MPLQCTQLRRSHMHKLRPTPATFGLMGITTRMVSGSTAFGDRVMGMDMAVITVVTAIDADSSAGADLSADVGSAADAALRAADLAADADDASFLFSLNFDRTVKLTVRPFI